MEQEPPVSFVAVAESQKVSLRCAVDSMPITNLLLEAREVTRLWNNFM